MHPHSTLQQTMIDGNFIAPIQHTLQTVPIEALHNHQSVPRPGDDLQHPHNVLVLQVEHVCLIPQRIVPAAVLPMLFHNLHRHVLALVGRLDDHAVATATENRIAGAVALGEFVPKEALPVRGVEVDLDLRDGEFGGVPLEGIEGCWGFVLNLVMLLVSL